MRPQDIISEYQREALAKAGYEITAIEAAKVYARTDYDGFNRITAGRLYELVEEENDWFCITGDYGGVFCASWHNRPNGKGWERVTAEQLKAEAKT